MSYESEYRDLIIKQYWDKPKARTEIEFKAARSKKIFDILDRFPIEMDVDEAYGHRLDIIGNIVGLKRRVPSVIPKIAFGFDGNPNARGFDSKFELRTNTAPFARKFTPDYTDLELDDNTYYLFLKAKISKNIASPYMVDSDGVSIQQAVNDVFGGNAYVVDNFNMTLELYVSPEYDIDRIRAIFNSDLLPKPQGVRYSGVTSAIVGSTFGFSNNSNSKGFADKFDSNREGGIFARKVIL